MSFIENLMKIKEPLIGVDLGYESLKVVQVNHASSPTTFMSANFLATKPHSLMKNLKEDKIVLTQTIRKALDEARPRKITTRLAVSGLPESRVFTKVIEMPAMTEEELAEAVPYEAGRHIPLPPDETYLDWALLGTGNSKTLDVLVIGAPKLLVEIYTEIFQNAGLELIALETKPIAAGRALTAPTDDTKPIVILDIGAEATGVSVFDQGNIKFTYTTPHGGNTLTKAISHHYRLNLANAEKLKREHGIDPQSKEGNRILKATEPILKDIIEEIVNAINFYQNRNPNHTKIEQIKITGGGAKTKGLVSYIMDATGISADIGNPLINLNSSSVKKFPQEELPRYTTAIGLALRDSF